MFKTDDQCQGYDYRQNLTPPVVNDGYLSCQQIRHHAPPC